MCRVGRFSAQLYQLTGRRGMLILYAYALLGFGCLRAVAPDFGGLAQRVRLPNFHREDKGILLCLQNACVTCYHIGTCLRMHVRTGELHYTRLQ